ncbi:MAG TPA: hypothetical protein VMT71_00405 [Syntrophorhabdales bacterium]|nr:hypothetical protein [Syntrophorhabdales bacterium]
MRYFVLSFLLLFTAFGCSSINSQSVRDLIHLQTEKIDQASKNAQTLTSGTEEAIKNWQKSVASLSGALENQRKIESVNSLIFSANRSLATEKGINAHASLYMIGQVYLKDRMGFEQTVLDQFDQDYGALRTLARQIGESWKALQKTQQAVDDFSQRSSLASVDTNLVRSLIIDFKGDTAAIDQVLIRSTQVNDALRKASGMGLPRGNELSGVQGLNEDLINLLQQIKTKSP